jgi:hypothetical protein
MRFSNSRKAELHEIIYSYCSFTALRLPISIFEGYEEGHGRIENRRVSLYVSDESMPRFWKYITWFIKVRRWGIRDKKE